jgi:hypothetical protein
MTALRDGLQIRPIGKQSDHAAVTLCCAPRLDSSATLWRAIISSSLVGIT